MRRKSAFTLIELLVVVAIIAVLIAILLPSLNRAKDSAKKTVCASQLKTQGMLVALYAAQFSDAVPYFANGNTSYPDDEPVEFGNTLLDISLQVATSMNGSDAQDSMRKIFWCPNNVVGIGSANQWSSNNVGVGSGFRTMGYAYFNIRRLPGTEAGTNWDNLGQNLLPAPRVPPLVFLTKWSNNQFSSQTEFAEDLMYGPSPGQLAADLSNMNWVAAAGDTNFPNTSSGTLMVDHRKSYTGPPSGVNVLCCDGHGEWRTFAPGKMHYQKVQGPALLFWFYPDP